MGPASDLGWAGPLNGRWRWGERQRQAWHWAEWKGMIQPRAEWKGKTQPSAAAAAVAGICMSKLRGTIRRVDDIESLEGAENGPPKYMCVPPASTWAHQLRRAWLPRAHKERLLHPTMHTALAHCPTINLDCGHLPLLLASSACIVAVCRVPLTCHCLGGPGLVEWRQHRTAIGLQRSIGIDRRAQSHL